MAKENLQLPCRWPGCNRVLATPRALNGHMTQHKLNERGTSDRSGNNSRMVAREEEHMMPQQQIQQQPPQRMPPPQMTDTSMQVTNGAVIDDLEPPGWMLGQIMDRVAQQRMRDAWRQTALEKRQREQTQNMELQRMQQLEVERALADRGF